LIKEYVIESRMMDHRPFIYCVKNIRS